MNKQKIVATALLVSIIFGAGIFFAVEKKKVQKERQRQVETEKIEEDKRLTEERRRDEETNQTVAEEQERVKGTIEKLANGWQKYRNEIYGFELSYPGDWKFRLIEDLDYGDGIQCYFFEKNLNDYHHVMICPNGGFSYGVEKPKIVYDKFKGRESKMFWYDDKIVPSYVYILNELPEKWNDENILEFVGDDMDLKRIYDSFGFIE